MPFYLKFLGYFAFPLFFYCLFIGGGFFLVGIESLGYIPAFDFNEFSLSFYVDIFKSKNFLSSFFFSIYIALSSTILSLILGIYFAQYLVFTKEKITSFLLEKLAKVFLILPYLYIVFLVFFMFSDTGLLFRFLHVFGIENSIGILYNNLALGIIFAYTLKGTPFVMLFLVSIMKKIRNEYYTISTILGANHFQTITSLYIPLCKHAIIWSALILFSYNLGSYEVPMLLTSVKQQSLSQLIFKYYTSPELLDFPKAMALNILLLFINIILGAFLTLILSKAIDRCKK